MARDCRLHRRLMCSAALVVLSLSASANTAAAGQAGASSATILGQVADDGGGVLPGVTVTATSPALLVPDVTVVTDERGEYRITPLPIGTYTLEYSLSGFQTLHREGVRLTAGFTARVDVVLGVGLQETVTVSGAAPVVDVASTSAVTNLTTEVLQRIPTGRQGYIGLMQLAPGARPPLDVGGSSANVNPSFRAFGMEGEAWQSLDGVVTKNPRSSDSGNYFDFTAFEEASVATLGHDASVPNRGVVVNTVVKSGGDSFHGGVFYGGTSSRFETAPEDQEGGNLKLRDDINGELGGPIVRNKTWFWVGARSQRNETNVLDCFQPDGSLCVGQAYAKFLTPKVTYQITPSHRLTGFAGLGFRDDVESLSALTAWESRRNQYGFQGASKVEWQGLKGNAIVMHVLVGGFWNHSGTECDPDSCDQIARLDRDTGQITGLINRAGENNREGRNQIRANMSWYKPNWAGGESRVQVWRGLLQRAGEQAHRGPWRRAQLQVELPQRSSRSHRDLELPDRS